MHLLCSLSGAERTRVLAEAECFERLLPWCKRQTQPAYTRCNRKRDDRCRNRLDAGFHGHRFVSHRVQEFRSRCRHIRATNPTRLPLLFFRTPLPSIWRGRRRRRRHLSYRGISGSRFLRCRRHQSLLFRGITLSAVTRERTTDGYVPFLRPDSPLLSGVGLRRSAGPSPRLAYG